MGADGGTIPKRCELVRKKKKEEKIEKTVKNAAKWRTCQLSQQPLKKPIIACRFGRMYNKEAVIEAILNKTIGSIATASHIKGLKDFKELRLTANKDFSNDGVKGDAYLDHNQTPYICPVTTDPMNGNNVFVLNWKCGCVFSEKAMHEVKSDVCHGCGGMMNADDIVVIYPDDELLQKYKERLYTERKTAKERKTAAKECLTQVDDVRGAKKSASFKVENGTSQVSTSVPFGEAAAAVRQVKRAEKRKAGESSVQDDPTKSDVYKKLFTSCEEAKNKPQAHWVTHNPLFY